MLDTGGQDEPGGECHACRYAHLGQVPALSPTQGGTTDAPERGHTNPDTDPSFALGGALWGGVWGPLLCW